MEINILELTTIQFIGLALIYFTISLIFGTIYEKFIASYEYNDSRIFAYAIFFPITVPITILIIIIAWSSYFYFRLKIRFRKRTFRK